MKIVSNPPIPLTLLIKYYRQQIHVVLQCQIIVKIKSVLLITLTEAFSACPLTNTTRGPQQVGVFTDSLSNIETIKKGVAAASEQKALFNTLKASNLDITFYHTRSHNGITRNEAVDKLCDLNINNPDRVMLDRASVMTGSQIKEWVKNWCATQRKRRLAEAEDKHDTRDLIKTIMNEERGMPKLHKNLPRSLGVLLSKARTNMWTNCRWFLHYIKKANDPHCKTCSAPDTTQHVLNDCRRHMESRQKMLKQFKQRYKLVTEMLCTRDKDELEMLGKFLQKIEAERKDDQEQQ